MRLVYIVGNQTMLKGKLLINCVYECRYYAYSTCTVNSMWLASTTQPPQPDPHRGRTNKHRKQMRRNTADIIYKGFHGLFNTSVREFLTFTECNGRLRLIHINIPVDWLIQRYNWPFTKPRSPQYLLLRLSKLSVLTQPYAVYNYKDGRFTKNARGSFWNMGPWDSGRTKLASHF